MTKENINGILTYGCKIYLFWSVTNEDIKRYLTAERDAMKTGYSIKTWKMRLFCPEKQMIETTEALYREAVAFYYELLKESEELWAENLLTIQGYLEKLTVPGRDGREPKYIPPGGKLPVYFRRSAMNKAAMAVKTAASAESFPEKIDANITFFKGMYRDLTDTSVVLKSRGSYLMGLTTYGKYEIEDQVNFTVYVPKVDEHFVGSLAVIPLQLLGYYVSVAKGLDVDKPRNLAKSVTVE